jgi:hypothetical protein
MVDRWCEYYKGTKRKVFVLRLGRAGGWETHKASEKSMLTMAIETELADVEIGRIGVSEKA